MAEITNNSKRGKSTAAKKSVRVDLTPMVDLGFLLITFFVFTTTVTRAKVMDLVSPYDKTTERDGICNSCVLTLLLAKNDQVFYYSGELATATVANTNFREVRNLIQQKKRAVKAIPGRELVLVIKASDDASFKNFIDITDEVSINTVKRYYLDELSAAEKKLLAQQEPE